MAKNQLWVLNDLLRLEHLGEIIPSCIEHQCKIVFLESEWTRDLSTGFPGGLTSFFTEYGPVFRWLFTKMAEPDHPFAFSVFKLAVTRGGLSSVRTLLRWITTCCSTEQSSPFGRFVNTFIFAVSDTQDPARYRNALEVCCIVNWAASWDSVLFPDATEGRTFGLLPTLRRLFEFDKSGRFSFIRLVILGPELGDDVNVAVMNAAWNALFPDMGLDSAAFRAFVSTSFSSVLPGALKFLASRVLSPDAASFPFLVMARLLLLNRVLEILQYDDGRLMTWMMNICQSDSDVASCVKVLKAAVYPDWLGTESSLRVCEGLVPPLLASLSTSNAAVACLGALFPSRGPHWSLVCSVPDIVPLLLSRMDVPQIMESTAYLLFGVVSASKAEAMLELQLLSPDVLRALFRCMQRCQQNFASVNCLYILYKLQRAASRLDVPVFKKALWTTKELAPFLVQWLVSEATRTSKRQLTDESITRATIFYLNKSAHTWRNVCEMVLLFFRTMVEMGVTTPLGVRRRIAKLPGLYDAIRKLLMGVDPDSVVGSGVKWCWEVVFKKHLSEYYCFLLADMETSSPIKSDVHKCAICFDGDSDLATLVLPCHHVYHTPCLTRWLTMTSSKKHCPMCRRDVGELWRLAAGEQ